MRKSQFLGIMVTTKYISLKGVVLLYIISPFTTVLSPSHMLITLSADTFSYNRSLTNTTVSSDSRRFILDVTVQPPLACEHVLEGTHAGPHLVNHFLLHQVEAHCY